MGISPACIAAVRTASGDTLDDAQATDLLRYMEDARKAEVAKGNIDNLDARLRQLAADGAERERIAAALQAKHAALSAIAYDRSLREVRAFRAQGLDWKRSVLAMFEGTVRNIAGGRGSVARGAMAYQARYLEPINRILVTDAEVAKRLRDPDFAAAVEAEMAELRPDGNPGVTRDPAALRLARAYERAAELSRLDLNRHGAPIGKLEGWRPQAHAAERVVKVSAEEWSDFILPRLDRDRTFPGMSEDGVRQQLRDMHQRIIMAKGSEPSAAQTTGRIGPANLANSLAAARVLHFTDSAAWRSYAERFGAGDIHAAMANHLTSAAKYAAQLERFGPNPDATITRMLATLQDEAAADPALTPQQRQTAKNQMDPRARFSSIGSAWAEVTGITAPPGNLTAATIMTNWRAVQSMAKLGGAVLSSLSDLGTRAINLSFQGKPLLATWGENLAELARGRGQGEVREIAAILDAGVEGMRSHIVAAGISEDMAMGWSQKWLARFFRWQGLALWQDAMKAGNARMLSRWMGGNADRGFAQLSPEYQRVLRQQGISPAEWNAIRATAWQAEDGARYVTPDRLDQVPRGQLAVLARDELEALQKGLAERVARRVEQDATEAGWLSKRTAGFAARLAEDRARLAKISTGAEGRRADQVAELRDRMAALEAELSELGEFRMAVAEGRIADPDVPEPPRPDGARGDFRPRAETYMDAGDAGTVAARAEGGLRARLDRLRRLIGETNRAAKAADVARLEGFDARWRMREAELTEFTLRMEARAEARARATQAEQADWSNRVDRILDDQRLRLEIKLRGFFADEQRFGYLETDAASRRVSLLNTAAPPGTLPGEALRTIMQFKGYPIAFTQRVLGRAVLGFGAPGQDRTVGDRLLQGQHIGQLLLLTTAFGYLSMTLKDIARGNEPRDPTRLKTLLAAMQQGGGAGIFGDFLFAEASRFGNKPLETALGPTAATAASFIDLFNAARDGDAKAGRALNLALANTPFASLWYVRPATELLFLNELRESLSPGQASRLERERYQNFGQRRWAPRSVWE
jgi:hypothetical protein